MIKKVNIALIGLGYWGTNYLRVLTQFKDVKLKYICDIDKGRFANCPNLINAVKVTNFEKLAEDRDLDAVIIATPASTHYKITRYMLESGKHVLVEKPLTMCYNQALELCNLSKKTSRVLMVGHIYCFNRAVRYMKGVLKNELEDLYYGIGLRMGLGPLRDDASCTWDLATHDIAMLDYLIGEMPISINAEARSFIRKGIYDYAVISLQYRNGFHFSLIVSWYAAEKIRIWYLMGSKNMLKFDDMNKSSPITIYHRGAATLFTGKEGGIVIPFIRYDEPLLLQVKHFIKSIKNNRQPLTDCRQGARVVKILEIIEESIKKRRAVDVNYEEF